MSRLFAHLLSVASLFLAGGAALAGDPIDPASYPAPVRVACVGDSITQGAGTKGNPYPGQLQGLLGDKWVVKNFGVSGRTLLKKGDHPYWNEKAFKDAQAFLPNVVVIMLGTNDTKPQNWAHREDFVSDYKELVKTFKDLESKPRVFVCRPCPVLESGNFNITETNLQQEIPWIDQIAAEEGVGVIDMHAALADKPEMIPDRVHPNAAGAGVMAQTVATALTGTPAARR